jgi:hypothetical protein
MPMPCSLFAASRSRSLAMWKNAIVHPGGREGVSRNEVVKSLKVLLAVAGLTPRNAQRIERW